jgi:hypothetical protein
LGYSQGCPVINATQLLPGFRHPSTCSIQAPVGRIAVSTTKEPPAVIATPAAFPRTPALNAMIAIILPMVAVGTIEITAEYNISENQE